MYMYLFMRPLIILHGLCAYSWHTTGWIYYFLFLNTPVHNVGIEIQVCNISCKRCPIVFLFTLFYPGTIEIISRVDWVDDSRTVWKEILKYFTKFPFTSWYKEAAHVGRTY